MAALEGFSVIVEKFVTSCNIFIINKLHTSIEVLSFLLRWDYRWKCEFDTDARIENYFHLDGEQLGFYKNKCKSKYRAKRFIMQEMPIDLKKNCTQENVKCLIEHEDSWLRLIVIEQINYK